MTLCTQDRALSKSKHASSRLQQLRSAAGPLTKSAILRAGGYAAIRKIAPSRQLAILRYHAVCGPEGYAYAHPGICTTPENFEKHIAYLTSAYNVLRLEDAVRALAGREPLPPNAVAITFDDGYADNLQAARILAKYGASGTFYLTAGCLAGGGDPFWPAELRYLVGSLPSRRIALEAGPARVTLDIQATTDRTSVVRQLTKVFKSYPIPVREELREQLRAHAEKDLDIPRVMLTWDEVREMHTLGMTLGSHTMTHPNLPNAGLEAARREVELSKATIEREIGAPVTMFSYPNGGADRYMTPEVAQVVRDTGFAAATTSRNAFADAKSDLFALERVQVTERLEDLAFALEVERFAFKPSPRPGEVD
jgi:peptidoglycan/xylan/chitin deacetylase (PgdA/CDA1 family)